MFLLDFYFSLYLFPRCVTYTNHLDWGEGGKGDNVVNGSKKSTGKAPMPPVERRLEQGSVSNASLYVKKYLTYLLRYL